VNRRRRRSILETEDTAKDGDFASLEQLPIEFEPEARLLEPGLLVIQ
jgi:hypothetical protein